MFARSFQIALARRVTAYFLLFGLAAIVWLGAGAFYISSAISRSQSTSHVLALMGQASHALALTHLEEGAEGLQEAIERLHLEHKLAYWAVVAPSGEYLSHSSPEEVGQSAKEPAGSVQTWGDVERVRFANANGVVTYEYRSPFTAGGRPVGSLRVGVTEPSLWRAALTAAKYGPLALCGPLAFLGLGTFVLRRLVRPVAEVEKQLRKVAVAPSVMDCMLEEVTVEGAVSLGWNRLVEQHAASEHAADLQGRLNRSLESVRYKKLTGILDSLGEGVLTTDREGNIAYHNSAVVALLERRQKPRPAGEPGPAAAEVSSKRERPPAEKVAATGQAAREALPALVSLEGDSMLTWLRRNWELPDDSPLLDPDSRQRSVLVELERAGEGERRVLRVTRSPLRLASSQEQDTHVWTLRDVTQQKLAEEMRTQFVDTATHELRTPLANIKAYAETLAMQEVFDVEQQKDFLNTINTEATRLARFVDDLLSVSSMEIGSLSLSKQRTDLERLFNTIIGKVKPQASEKGIAFETQFPEKWPEPELDKDKFAATVVNLLGNAVKYTPAGGRVGLRVKVNEGQLEVSVEDTASGSRRKTFRSCSTSSSGLPTRGCYRRPGRGSGCRWPTKSSGSTAGNFQWTAS